MVAVGYKIMTLMSKISKKFSRALWVKCYNCDGTIPCINLLYVLRIPEQHKYAGICEDCYKKRPGNAKPVSRIVGLEFDKILDLP